MVVDVFVSKRDSERSTGTSSDYAVPRRRAMKLRIDRW
jgi:hypothetical protein